MGSRNESDDTIVYDWWSRHPRAFDLAFLGREHAHRRLADILGSVFRFLGRALAAFDLFSGESGVFTPRRGR
ncbi:hypothetical protein [Haloprofundus salilacus]|uniref:hypothetical protein n=1 Tax=Haloprofundus salilacus TaxID=2876190 RepID=UPI001CCD4826|nr:hypothetical protein [Haloprofundus salilacus]